MRWLNSTQTDKNVALLRAFEIIILIWVLIFALQITFRAGEKGFFAFDQSIIFDGGYRVLTGQIPYKDFVIPFGPVTFWLQAAIFKIFGISYASYILGAAIINVLVTGGSYYLLRMLFPEQSITPYLGSLLTAIWFYPPFGTPWPEQTAFFFSFAALLSITAGLLNDQLSSLKKGALFFISGLFSFMAFISKQNAGAFFVPLLVVLILVTNLKSHRIGIKWFAHFSLGWIGGLLIFGLWLVTRSELRLFLRYFFEIPAAEVRSDRLPDSFVEILRVIFIGEGLTPIIVLSVLASLVAMLSFIFETRPKTTPPAKNKARLLSITLVPSLFLYHNIFLATSNNQPENSIPFIGLIAATSFGLLLSFQNTSKHILTRASRVWRAFGHQTVFFEPQSTPRLQRKTFMKSSRPLRLCGSQRHAKRSSCFLCKNLIANILKYRLSTFSWIKSLSALTMLGLMVSAFWIGANIAISREVHGIFQESTFPYNLTIDKLSALKWGEPTRIQKLIPPEDINQLTTYLAEQDENFFIFPDFTIFYGILGVPSPQPLVWFHPGLTYSKIYDPALDAWIVSDLKENQVRIIVIEEHSWFFTEDRLDDFPQLESFITERFTINQQIGNFIIYVQEEH